MSDNNGKHLEEVKIYSHFINYTGGLSVKAMCDIFADLASQHSANLGFDIESMNANGQTWMLHRLHLIINSMPRKNETVQFETWSSATDRLFALRDYQVVRNENEILVKATSEWMMIDIARRRPIRLSPIVLNACQNCTATHLQIPSMLNEKEITSETVFSGSKEFSATFDHIDFNGHVTQAVYMRWITNALSFDFLKSHILTEIEIVYEHEVMPDSTISSQYKIEEQGDQLCIIHKITALSGNQIHCYAKSMWKEISK